MALFAAATCGMAIPMEPIGTFTDYQGFIALLRRRKAELGLSDLALDAAADLTHGHTSKLLGPGHTKGLGAMTFTPLLDALGLSGRLFADPAKAKKMSGERRREGAVHPNSRIGKDVLKKARPVVLGDLARKAAAARWQRATPEQRQAFGNFLVEARRRKQAGMSAD
jgi:hypothetical protein